MDIRRRLYGFIAIPSTIPLLTAHTHTAHNRMIYAKTAPRHRTTLEINCNRSGIRLVNEKYKWGNRLIDKLPALAALVVHCNVAKTRWSELRLAKLAIPFGRQHCRSPSTRHPIAISVRTVPLCIDTGTVTMCWVLDKVAIEVHCQPQTTPQTAHTERSSIGGRSFSGKINEKKTEIQITSKFVFLAFGLSLTVVIIINTWPNTADDRSHFLSTHDALRNCRHKTCRAQRQLQCVCAVR